MPGRGAWCGHPQAEFHNTLGSMRYNQAPCDVLIHPGWQLVDDNRLPKHR